jgi:hypothetical protein
MGFNFLSGHPDQVFGAEAAALHARALRERFGDSVPLGDPHADLFCLQDQIGWPWWQQLQARAARDLGEDATRQIRAVDAWSGVYIDTDVDREVLWPEGRSAPNAATAALAVPEMHPATPVVIPKVSFFVKFLRFFGVPIGPPAPIDPTPFIGIMVDQFGARAGERGALQVGNLRLLIPELEALLGALDVKPTQEAVGALLRSYSEDDAKADSDPEVQCLCHAWLTARHALENRTPLWLIK